MAIVDLWLRGAPSKYPNEQRISNLCFKGQQLTLCYSEQRKFLVCDVVFTILDGDLWFNIKSEIGVFLGVRGS